MADTPLVTVVTPCFNEQDNVVPLHEAVAAVFTSLPQYRWEHLFIDNASTDDTVARLRELAVSDPEHVKAIVNVRNFGQVRSPYHAILVAEGDAVIGMAADMQDPPDLIPRFLEQWEAGYRIVLGVKTASEENPIMFAMRRAYYRFVATLSDVRQVQNATGFGLYDRQVIDILRQIDDPYPYFRGLIAELGFEPALIEFHQPQRRSGITKNNFYSLYDLAMLGITSHTKVPLRIATMAGFAFSALSLLVGIGYFVYKLLNWSSFSIGVAPLVIGVFFGMSLQLFFLGIVGEYIGAMHTQILRRPLVVEKERINFE